MTSSVVQLNGKILNRKYIWLYYTERCPSNLAPEINITKETKNIRGLVAVAILLAPVSFRQKPNIPFCNPLK